MSDEAYQDLKSPDDVDAIMTDSAGAVVIDFWSSTCAPCKAMAPDFRAVAQDFREQPVQFCKVQTDAYPELAAPFHIRSVPTLIFALDGQIIDAAVGRMDGPRLTKKVDWLLSKQRGDGFFARLFGR